MSKHKLFADLSRALGSRSADLSALSAMTGISLSSLDDMSRDAYEWYGSIPLYKVRFLCSVLGVDFNGAFAVPELSQDIRDEWERQIKSNYDQLVRELYMGEAFWRFLLVDYSVLNICPFEWIDDIARVMKFEIAKVLALLSEQD